MEHISDINMLDMLGGHIDENKHRQLMHHIDDCPDCRRRWQEYRRTWQVLAEFDADVSHVDLVDRINSALSKTSAPSSFPFAGSLLRIAASILLAVVIGHLAGKWSLQKSEEYWQSAAAQSLHLETLLPNSATGWAEPLLEDDFQEEDSQLP
ncbi:MAG: hypothetical protein AMJ79_15450 [Phycisphaerae bacterium SM23_30]|nr:MAG: hypothetical protein AMJ79_15450 [Phycisphaerae bacterium SM23_30]